MDLEWVGLIKGLLLSLVLQELLQPAGEAGRCSLRSGNGLLPDVVRGTWQGPRRRACPKGRGGRSVLRVDGLDPEAQRYEDEDGAPAAGAVEALGLRVLEMHSRKSQPQRTRIADEFRDGKKLVMFTSDVSARGTAAGRGGRGGGPGRPLLAGAAHA